MSDSAYQEALDIIHSWREKETPNQCQSSVLLQCLIADALNHRDNRIAALEQRIKELQGREKIILTGYQLKEILELACPDGDEGQLSESVTIFYRVKDEFSTETAEPELLPKGYYFYWNECLEEGCIGPIAEAPAQEPSHE